MPDVRMHLLIPTDRVTHCPYKGQARYWSLQGGSAEIADVVWSYRHPLPESMGIAGLVCFDPSKVDVQVHGVSQR